MDNIIRDFAPPIMHGLYFPRRDILETREVAFADLNVVKLAEYAIKCPGIVIPR